MWTMTSLVSATSVFSILANFFVIFVILRHSQFIGWYKYILAAYCFHEAFCAFIVAILAPVHFVYDNTYIVFSTGSWVEGTELAKYGSGLYCGLLLMWAAFTLYLFLYRYLVVCHTLLYQRILQSCLLKSIIILAAIFIPIYLLICGLYWCRMAEIPNTVNHQLLVDFNITNISHHGYMFLRLVNDDGKILVYGTLATVNHYLAHVAASIGMVFCTVSLYRKLTDGSGVANIKRQRKLFRMLIVQSAIPLFCFEAPAFIYLTFPFWASINTFGYTAPIMTCLLSLPKLLDPIVLILFVTEYRRAVWAMLNGRRVVNSVESVPQVISSKGKDGTI